MANKLRLTELSMVPELASEVAGQIDGAVAEKTQIAALTAVSTADGSDAATTQALANALKVKVNEIIAALKA